MATRRSSAMNDQADPNGFCSSPRDMDSICYFLNIYPNSPVHKSILKAIVQTSGYGESNVNDGYQIDTRVRTLDGKLSPILSEVFKRLVDNFLVSRKGGVTFFPDIMPQYDGWEESYFEDRLEWLRRAHQSKIRRGMEMLFECVNLNPEQLKNFDLANCETFESFPCENCKICGSGNSTPGNRIVICSVCYYGYHQLCYDIKKVPKSNWYCNGDRCLEEKPKQEGNKKRQHANSMSPPPPGIMDDIGKRAKKQKIHGFQSQGDQGTPKADAHHAEEAQYKEDVRADNDNQWEKMGLNMISSQSLSPLQVGRVNNQAPPSLMTPSHHPNSTRKTQRILKDAVTLRTPVLSHRPINLASEGLNSPHVMQKPVNGTEIIKSEIDERSISRGALEYPIDRLANTSSAINTFSMFESIAQDPGANNSNTIAPARMYPTNINQSVLLGSHPTPLQTPASANYDPNLYSMSQVGSSRPVITQAPSWSKSPMPFQKTLVIQGYEETPSLNILAGLHRSSNVNTSSRSNPSNNAVASERSNIPLFGRYTANSNPDSVEDTTGLCQMTSLTRKPTNKAAVLNDDQVSFPSSQASNISTISLSYQPKTTMAPGAGTFAQYGTIPSSLSRQSYPPYQVSNSPVSHSFHGEVLQQTANSGNSRPNYPSLSPTSLKVNQPEIPQLTEMQHLSTILLLRIKETKEHRYVHFRRGTDSLQSLKELCASAWLDKFGDQGIGYLLAELPGGGDGFMGLRTQNDFVNFVRVIKRKWKAEGVDCVTMRLCLLAVGEDAVGL